MEDQKIIALFFARNEQAIEALRQRYGRACQQLARNILKNERDAEECVSDTYLAVWNNIPPDRPDPLAAYVLRIARNIAIAKYHANTAIKRNSHYDTALDELEECLAAPDTVEQQVMAGELSCAIDRFLGTLDRDSRMLFVRRYWYGDSVTDMAKRFHISAHNASVRLGRIREKLKKYLKKEGFVP